MKKTKALIVALTLFVAVFISLYYMIVIKVVTGSTNDSPVIILNSDNARNLEVGSTKLANDNNESLETKAEKTTVTSRSGKHEALSDIAQEENPEQVQEQPPAMTNAQEQNEIEEDSSTVETQEEPEDNSEETVEEVDEDEDEDVEVNVEEERPSYQGVELEYSARYNVTSSYLTKSKGAIYYNGHKETYYSQRVLPGKGLKALNNNGRHVADDGTVRDGDGYIAVACNYLPKGSEIMTSLGPGKVYDTGSMTGKWIDIYVNW